MGVPGMYRWISDRYPDTICSVASEDYYSIDVTHPNPNGVEFDNLYIDLNGIIHPCFNPTELAFIPPPTSERDILIAIENYIDKVFSIVRPRKLLFLALDGVAPRAKMNHQRIRRFRKAKESAHAKVSSVEKMDSNVITPGTEFMALLSFTLKCYVDYKISKSPEWKNINVILSDSTVVGEGEYKIMSFIRSQRNLPHYDPNTRHCVHGLDADLIMLTLATHEIHFSILREVITYGRQAVGRRNHKCNHLYSELMPIFIHQRKFERGMELLLIVYQQEFVKMGYLTNAPEVNLKSMEHFLQALGSHENAIFFKRSQHQQASIVELQSKSKPDDDVESTTSKKNLGYYFEKFECKSHDIDRIRRDAVLKYTEGVCWIMHYYYQGLCSWQWFYPYHYAPLASDFCGLEKMEINFTLGQPLKPLNQLLGVLPAASAQALPLFYRELMTKESSPILDFYPKDAEVDRNGKRHEWQGVCKLPFIDESRLLSEAAKVESTLTDEEKQRNRFGDDKLFVHCRHPLSKFLKEHLLCDPSSELQISISPKVSGVTGYVRISDKVTSTFKIPLRMRMQYNDAISVDFKCRSPDHIPKLLCGVIMPPKILRCEDTPKPPVVWHSIGFESLTEKIQKEKKRKEATDGKQNGCTSEVHLVEGSPKCLFVDQIEQKDKQQVKSDSNEKASSRGEHESPSLEKKKKKKRKIRGDKLEAQLDLVEVVGVDVITEVGVDENMNGFPVSEKKVKKIKTKKKKHVNDEEKTKESLENNGVETHNCNQVVDVIPREKETENENAEKSQKKLRKKRVKEDLGTQEKEVAA